MITPTIEFATVDQWWQLAKGIPAYRQFTQSPLKDFGYLRLIEDLRQMGARRILEFGCGLWLAPEKNLWDLLPECEIWGVDDWQDLHYFPPEAEWTRQHEALRERFPTGSFVRGLIGRAPLLEMLPKGYFDAVVSVSVLEEITEHYDSVFPHCFSLLRPGGALLGTTDYCAAPLPAYPWQNTLRNCISSQRAAGFQVAGNFQLPQDIGPLLLENPVGVMLYYQGGEGDDRKYWGHFGTMYTSAVKPA